MARVVAEAVSGIIENRLQDPRIEGLISVTEVKMTPDLKNAHVYLSIMGAPIASEKKIFSAIEHAGGYIQTLLGQHVVAKFCPHLSFYLDDRLKRGAEMMEIISDVSDQTENTQDINIQNDIGDMTNEE